MIPAPLCRLTELDDPGSRGFQIQTPKGPADCVLVRRGGDVFGYLNRCPHTGAPLDWTPGQFLDQSGELIQCAMHGALFLIGTGECVRGPCVGTSLDPVPVALKDGWVMAPPGPEDRDQAATGGPTS
jgi:nitrite reductase/ring-hydroxylating ferredoxin subunit